MILVRKEWSAGTHPGTPRSGGSLWEGLTIKEVRSVHAVGVVLGMLSTNSAALPLSRAHSVPHWGGGQPLPRVICRAARDLPIPLESIPVLIGKSLGFPRVNVACRPSPFPVYVNAGIWKNAMGRS